MSKLSALKHFKVNKSINVKVKCNKTLKGKQLNQCQTKVYTYQCNTKVDIYRYHIEVDTYKQILD